MPTTAAEKPHWGICGLPFMKSMTRSLAMVSAMRWRRVSFTGCLLLALIFLGRGGLEREGVNGAAHGVAERGVDQAVAIDGSLTQEGGRDDGRGVMIPAARRVGHRDLGAGQRREDEGADLV